MPNASPPRLRYGMAQQNGCIGSFAGDYSPLKWLADVRSLLKLRSESGFGVALTEHPLIICEIHNPGCISFSGMMQSIHFFASTRPATLTIQTYYSAY
jgi:hypothetical protein